MAMTCTCHTLLDSLPTAATLRPARLPFPAHLTPPGPSGQRDHRLPMINLEFLCVCMVPLFHYFEKYRYTFLNSTVQDQCSPSINGAFSSPCYLPPVGLRRCILAPVVHCHRPRPFNETSPSCSMPHLRRLTPFPPSTELNLKEARRSYRRKLCMIVELYMCM